MDARNPKALIVLCVVAISMTGCRQDEAPPAETKSLPMLLDGEKTNSELLEAQFPGSKRYLASLAQCSDVGLIERLRGHCPFEHPADSDEEWLQWELKASIRWEPYDVFLITRGYGTQVILADDEGQYHLLVLDLVSWGPPSLDVVQVGDRPVLAYHASMGGNSCNELTGFFVQEGDDVAVVKVDEAIQAALEKVLPDGCFVWNGGGFDLASLTYKQFVWGGNDCHANPTYGTVRIEFDLVGHDLVARHCRYSPKQAEPTAVGPVAGLE
jgi:hypothetical protein